jgi:caspase 7
MPGPDFRSDVDVRNITRSLERLGFFFENPCMFFVFEDLKEKIEFYLDHVNFKDFSCYMCFILGIDDTIVYMFEDVFESFENCPGLVGKPKIIFVNPSSESPVLLSESEQLDNLKYVPGDDETVILYALVQSGVAWRDLKKGSFFIQCVCNVLDNQGVEGINLKLEYLVERIKENALTSYGIKSQILHAPKKLVDFKPNEVQLFKWSKSLVE